MGRLELPISDAILEAVGLSPDPNLDIMSRLWEAAPASSIVVSALVRPILMTASKTKTKTDSFSFLFYDRSLWLTKTKTKTNSFSFSVLITKTDFVFVLQEKVTKMNSFSFSFWVTIRIGLRWSTPPSGYTKIRPPKKSKKKPEGCALNLIRICRIQRRALIGTKIAASRRILLPSSGP